MSFFYILGKYKEKLFGAAKTSLYAEKKERKVLVGQNKDSFFEFLR